MDPRPNIDTSWTRHTVMDSVRNVKDEDRHPHLLYTQSALVLRHLKQRWKMFCFDFVLWKRRKYHKGQKNTIAAQGRNFTFETFIRFPSRRMMMPVIRLLIAIVTTLFFLAEPHRAFCPNRAKPTATGTGVAPLKGATTVEPPTRERTDRRTERREYENDDDGSADDNVDYPDLEYLQDAAESREMEDPFHILLLGSTFDKPKISISYVSGSLEYVLAMPYNEAVEQSRFAKQEGFSCLGTWPRQECVALGRQLQMRDIVCRVVPFAEGGQRGWQAKDAAGSSSSSSGSNSGDFFG